jgi:two-component system sensor histidine kinase QseC
MRLPRSLQGRLQVLIIAIVAGVWLATAALTWFDVKHELDELLDGHLAQAAALLVVHQANDMDEDDHGLDAPTLHPYAPKVTFQVFNEGRLAMRSSNAPTEPMIDPARRFRDGFTTVEIGGKAWRVFAAHGGKHDVQVYVAEQVRARASILWAVFRSSLWPMALALPLLSAAVWVAVYRGMGPLRRLGRTLAARKPQALDPVPLNGATSEIEPMIHSLNGLFERIGTLMETERRFTADAAHELRTPIAAIRAQAQVAMGEADSGLRQHALQATLDGCDRATRLVEQLLTLSKLDEVGKPEMAPVDLHALAQQAVGNLARRALGKGQTLEFEGGEPCLINGNETLLSVLLRNLVDNAMRYSPAGARVIVRVRGAALSVEDSGPGMSEADLQRLGERFFRVLGSEESGSGLGWSIVRRIAAVHELEVRVERSAELGGLAVHLAPLSRSRERGGG